MLVYKIYDKEGKVKNCDVYNIENEDTGETNGSVSNKKALFVWHPSVVQFDAPRVALTDPTSAQATKMKIFRPLDELCVCSSLRRDRSGEWNRIITIPGVPSRVTKARVTIHAYEEASDGSLIFVNEVVCIVPLCIISMDDGQKLWYSDWVLGPYYDEESYTHIVGEAVKVEWGEEIEKLEVNQSITEAPNGAISDYFYPYYLTDPNVGYIKHPHDPNKTFSWEDWADDSEEEEEEESEDYSEE